MGKILTYSSLGAAPADDDLLFLGDYSEDNANPTTKRLLISDLNKKRNVDAADGNGLKLRDDGGNYGVFIVDGGNVGMGSAIAPGVTDPAYPLDVRSTTDSTIRIEAGTANNAVLRLDQSGTAQAFVGYEHASSLMKVTNSPTLTDDHLTIDTSGNVIIKSDSATIGSNTYSLKANGDFAVLDGTYGIKIDASLANIEGIMNTGASGPLHLNRGGGQDIWFMYGVDGGAGVNIAGKIESDNRHWGIGNLGTGNLSEARLYVKEDSHVSNPVLKLHNSTTSADRTVIHFDTLGNDQFIIADANRLGISTSNAALGSGSVNFQGGKISVGSTDATHKLNVFGDGILTKFVDDQANAGAKLVIQSGSGSNDAAATGSSVIAFPYRSSSSTIANWSIGSLRISSADYFAINHQSSTFDGTNEAEISFDGTLANNDVTVDANANLQARGNVGADGFYDKGGTSAGNYCRGRFLQTFHVPIYAHNGGYVFPALGGVNAGQTNGYQNDSDRTPTADFTSRAPYAGRLTKIDVSAFLPVGEFIANITPKFYFYSGSTLPSADGDAGMGTTNSSNVSLGTQTIDTSFSVSKGYSEFADATVGGGTNTLNFSAADYLSIVLDPETTSGYFYANVAMTFEFLITD